MNYRISKHITDRIKKKHSGYYEMMDNRKFMIFVNSVASKLLFDKTLNDDFIEKILSGEKDDRIDELIDECAHELLPDVFAGYKELCQHIKEIIIESDYNKLKSYDGDFYLNNDTLDNIINKIAVNFIKKTKGNVVVMDHSYDQIFLHEFNDYFDNVVYECLKHVREINQKKGIKINNVFVRDYLLDSVINKCLSEYDIRTIKSGKFDEKIIKKIEEKFKESKERVKKYVKSIILNEVEINDMFGVNQDDVINYFIDDERIEDSILKVNSNVLWVDIKGYIREIQKRNKDERDLMYLLLTDDEVRKKNSVKGNEQNVSNKIRYNPKKRKISPIVLTLILVAAITAFITSKRLYDKADAFVTDIQYSSMVHQLENFDIASTEPIFTEYSDQYGESVDNILKFYKFCKKHGLDNPRDFCLGFNLTRNQLRVNTTLATMDDVLYNVQERVENVNGVDDLKTAISDSCFLEFAYEMLLDLECEEVIKKKETYFNLINEYEIAMSISQKNNYKMPFDYLSKSSQKDAKRLMELYMKYTKESVINFGREITGLYENNGFAVLLTAAPSGSYGNGRR